MTEQAAHLPWDDSDKPELIHLPMGESGSLLVEEWLTSDSWKLEKIADYFSSPTKDRKRLKEFALIVGVSEHSLEAWRHHPKMRQRITERLRAKATDALADGVEQASEILKTKFDVQVFEAVRRVALGDERGGAQVNVTIDARRGYTEGAVRFVENFRRRQKRLFERVNAIDAEVVEVRGGNGREADAGSSGSGAPQGIPGTQ